MKPIDLMETLKNALDPRRAAGKPRENRPLHPAEQYGPCLYPSCAAETGHRCRSVNGVVLARPHHNRLWKWNQRP